ncbi:MAG: hypothetical protein KC549_01285 [Myxococcales bacterium]|nr:hypothetical protein [Myxococcales bacterium]MCB9547977.1 hypothetical protein [Myxococcales bacterium]
MTRWMAALAALVWMAACDSTEPCSCVCDDVASWSEIVSRITPSLRPPAPPQDLIAPLAAGVCVLLPNGATTWLAVEPELDVLVEAVLSDPSRDEDCDYPVILHLPVAARVLEPADGVDVEVPGERAIYLLESHVINVVLWVRFGNWRGAVEVNVAEDGTVTAYALWDAKAAGQAACAPADVQRPDGSQP